MNDIVRLGGNQEYTKDQINETIELLLDNGYIYEPISGYFRKHRELKEELKNENE